MCTKQDIRNVVKEITQEILSLNAHVEKVILYGSCARGDNTSDSDIDIMILLDDNKENVAHVRKQFYTVASDISLKYDVLVSVLFRDKTSFEEQLEYKPFYKNIAQEGIVLYGRAA